MVLFAWGCSGDERPDGAAGRGGGGGDSECIDQDGDGFGEGCGEDDCDDGDSEVTDQCRSCKTPKPGCPCSEPNTTAPCGEVHTEIGGQAVCGKGRMVCDVDTWGECVITNVQMIHTKPKTLYDLGDPTNCSTNPCDPYCHEWPDNPDGLDPGGGTTVKDDSITLDPPGTVGGGISVDQCHGGTVGNCAHHVCQQGDPLTAGCDTVGVSSACIAKNLACPGATPCCYGLSCIDGTCEEVSPGPGNIFYESFYNATGWTTTGEWEIGAAQASSGHTYGQSDPSSDADTSTSNNWLAGVDIGGNVNVSYGASPADPDDAVAASAAGPSACPKPATETEALAKGYVGEMQRKAFLSGSNGSREAKEPRAFERGTLTAERPATDAARDKSAVRPGSLGSGETPATDATFVKTFVATLKGSATERNKVLRNGLSTHAASLDVSLDGAGALSPSGATDGSNDVPVSTPASSGATATASPAGSSPLYSVDCQGVPVWVSGQPVNSYNLVTQVVGGINKKYQCDYASGYGAYCPWAGAYQPGLGSGWDLCWNYLGDCSTADTTPPSVPTGLELGTTTATTIQLLWAAATDNVGVTGYKVFQGSTYYATVTGTTYTFAGLQPSTGYTLKVSAVDAEQNESAQATTTGTTAAAPDTTAPTTPTNLTLGTITSSSVVLNWTASTDAVGVTHYEMYRNGTLVTTIPAATTYTFTSLTSGTTYTLGVKARDAAGNTSGLATKSATTSTPDTTAPSMPTSLSLGTITSSSVVLNWAASTDNVGVTGYQLYEGATLVSTVTGTNYTFTGLAASTQYTLGVKAYDAAGNLSALATMTATTLAPADTTAPSVPTDLSLGAVSGTSVQVQWEASTDNVAVTGYKLYNSATLVTTVTGTNYTFTGLTVGGTYTFGVKAYDAAGNESAMATIPATTIDVSPPTTPTGLVTSNITQTSITLSWTASTDDAGAGVVGYDIYNGGTLVTSTASLTYNFTGLTVNTAYTLGVQAYDAAGNKSALATKAAYTQGCIPACSGKQCGSDGCGGSCGTCPGSDVCSTSQTCVHGNLKAWWPLNEQSSSGSGTRDDVMGNVDGTPDGDYAPNWTSSGKVGNAMRLDDISHSYTTSQHLRLPYNSTNSLGPLLDGASGVSISAWVYRQGDKSGGCSSSTDERCDQAILWGYPFHSTNPLNFVIKADNKLSCGTATSQSYGLAQHTATTTVSDDTWYHVVCVIDVAGDAIKIYRDNGSASTGSFAFTLTALQKTSTLSGHYDKIGNGTNTVSSSTYQHQLWGRLDQVKLFDKALSGTEVGYLFGEADTTAPTNPSSLTLGTVTQTSVYLSWTASSDAAPGIKGYEIYLDGTLITTIYGTTTNYTYTGLVPATTYTLGVKGLNYAGLTSSLVTKSATTSTCTPSCSGKECGSDGCGGSCGSCSGTNTCNASQICSDPNLVAWWKFDESSGTSLTDSVGTNTGTMQTTYPTRVTGLIGGGSGYGALNFGGNGQVHLKTDTTGELAPLIHGSSGISVSAWINRTGPRSGCSGSSSSSCRQQILYSFATSSGGGFTMRVNEDNKFACGMAESQGQTFQLASSTGSMSSLGWDGTWIHVVCIFDVSGDKIKIYKNGSLHVSQNVSFPGSSVQNTSSAAPGEDAVGGHYSGDRAYYGKVDQLKVFKKALTGAEVTTLFNEYGDTQAPSAPTGLTVGTPGLNSLPLSWTASTDNSGVAGYELYLGATLVTNVIGTNYTFTALNQGTQYTLGVKAYDAAGNRSSLATVNGTTATADVTAPSTPTGLSLTNITSTSIRLNWTASTDNVGVVGYQLFNGASIVATISAAPPPSGAPSPAVNYDFTGLTVNTAYTLGVKAVDAAGNISALASTSGSTVDTTAPSTPSGLLPGATTPTSIALSWNVCTDNVGVTGYKLYSNGTYVATVTGLSYTFTGLTQGATYTLGVKSVDAAGNESALATDTSSTSDTQAPTAPTGLSVSNIQTTSLKLSWNASTDNTAVAGYNMYLNGIQIASTPSLNYTYSGLAGATSYTLGVKAYDNSGNESTLSTTTGTTSSGPGTFYWVTSPAINTADITGPMTLEYKRRTSTLDTAWMTLKIQIRNSVNNWVDVWAWAGYSWYDTSWVTRSFDITAYKHANMALRWGYAINDINNMPIVSGWSIDDVKVIGNLPGVPCSANGGSCSDSTASCCSAPSCLSGVCVAPSETSCVDLVCAELPGCCSTVWNAPCVVKYKQVCNTDCAVNEAEQCVLCYKDGVDHDNDGFTWPEDCLECDPTTNPGAFDFLNTRDDDCNGQIDDEVTDCDLQLSSISPTDAKDYARAMDICRFTSSTASGSARTWGVTSAMLQRANETEWTSSTQRAVKSRFGTNNLPREGNKLAVFSSGAARDKDDSGYIAPNPPCPSDGSIPCNGSFQQSSYDKVTPPSGFPKNKAGCDVGVAAYDSMGLKLNLRAPTNAQSFGFNFGFFTSEYPEWVCTDFNDTFIARYTGSLNPFSDKNISFDATGSPVTVNIGFFSIPGGNTVYNHAKLLKTGLEGSCKNPNISEVPGTTVCGGSTDWLKTTAPVIPGEEITLSFVIWDTGDKKWDSTVIMDNFTWAKTTANIVTLPDPPPPPLVFTAGDFLRTYDAGTVCQESETPIWGLWGWETSTPSDSSIEFFVRSSDTLAGLDSATEVPLRFKDVPASLDGQPAVAETSPVNTTIGSVPVHNTLLNAGLNTNAQYVRVRSHLVPSSDGNQAPGLSKWNLQVSCQPNQ